MFDKDISNMSKPEIKGRGFVGTGNDIIETQTYYTQPEKDWVFDEDMLLTYNNPVFKEQCKLRNIKIDDLNTGWVKQVPLDKQDNDDSDEDEEEEEDLDLNENSSKEDEEDDDWDWDDDEEEKEEKEEEDKESSESKDSVEAKLNDISFDNLAKMFSDDPKEEKSSESTADEPIVSDLDSTRDKVYDALNDAPVEKPKIKLTFDPTTKPKTNKIKFNRPDSDFKSDPPT